MTPLRIVLTYAAAATAWIVITDLLFVNAGYLPSALKGLAFVGLTALLLFRLLRIFESEVTKERIQTDQTRTKFDALVESAPIGLFVQCDGRFHYLNPAALRLFGAEDEAQLLGRPVLDRFDKEIGDGIRQGLAFLDGPKILATATVRTCITLDGRRFAARVSAVSFEHNGEPDALVYLEDVTAQTDRNRLLLDLARAVPAVVFIADSDGIRRFFNDNWYQFTGQRADADAHQSWIDAIHPGDRARVLAVWDESMRSRTAFETRVRFRRHDGEYRWFMSWAVPAFLPDGRVANWFGFGTDIDEAASVLQQMETAIENERLNLSRELHDELGQLLVAAKLNVELALRSPEGAPGKLGKARDNLIACIQRTRNMSMILRPAMLELGGLIAALRELAEHFVSPTGVRCTFTANAAQVELPPAACLAVYRVVQEALTNIAKHSDATQASLDVKVLPDGFRASVCDNGRGFDVHSSGRRKGIGLIGMKERAIGIGAILTIQSGPQGTIVQIDLRSTP